MTSQNLYRKIVVIIYYWLVNCKNHFWVRIEEMNLDSKIFIQLMVILYWNLLTEFEIRSLKSKNSTPIIDRGSYW